MSIPSPDPAGRPRSRPAALLVLCTLLLPLPISGQETESPLSPAGRLRLQVAPAFVSWDSRYGEEGSVPLGFDLDGLDAAELFPGVPELESRLRELVGDPELVGSLGMTRARVSADRVELPFRLDLGVTDWLTLGVTVPMVKARTEIAVEFDSAGANLGGNPAVTDVGAVAAYLEGLATARTAAAGRAEELCASDPASEPCMSATALAEDVASFRDDLSSAYGASFLFPTTDSGAGTALLDRSDALEGRLVDAGLEDLPNDLPLGRPLPDRATLDDFLSDAFAIPGSALGNPAEIWELGDMELHVAVRLLEGASRDSVGGPVRTRWQVGAAGLVRLGTGARDDPAIAFDHPAGDGQTDLEGRAFANVQWGRLGLWSDVRYGVPLSTTVSRRVGPRELLFLAPASLARLEWTSGSYLRLEVAPRFHLTDELAFSGGYHLWSKGEDRYERVSPPPEPPAHPFVPTGPLFTDPSLLESQTAETRHELGAGLVFNTLEAWREGRAPLPLEGRFTLRWSVAGSGGRTPETFRTGFLLRLYHRLWGE